MLHLRGHRGNAKTRKTRPRLEDAEKIPQTTHRLASPPATKTSDETPTLRLLVDLENLQRAHRLVGLENLQTAHRLVVQSNKNDETRTHHRHDEIEDEKTQTRPHLDDAATHLQEDDQKPRRDVDLGGHQKSNANLKVRKEIRG